MIRPSNGELLEEYGGHAYRIAVQWDRGAMRDDYVQEAKLALIEAAEAADWERIEAPGQFVMFAQRHIKNALSVMSASMEFATTGSSTSLNEHKGFQRSVSADVLDYRVEPHMWEDDSWMELDAIMSTLDDLTARQRRVIGLYYLDGILDDAKVADVLEVTREAVFMTRKKAEARIREILASDLTI